MSFTSIKVLFITDLTLLQNQYIIQVDFLHNYMVKNVTAFLVIFLSTFGFIIVFIVTFRHIRQLIINYKIKELIDN